MNQLAIQHNYNGLLFIGDPHLSSKRIGRRIDDYTNTALNKIDQAFSTAYDNNLLPIVLGDLFHRANDTDPTLLTKLFEIIRKRPIEILSIVGNHDIKDTTLTENTAMSIIKASGLVYVIDTPQSVVIKDLCAAHFVPYGFDIPNEVSNNFKLPNIVITHHDLNFGMYSENIIALKPIKNCRAVINGHLHVTQKPIKVGETTYFNPGNITRLTLDTVDHIPSVWIWRKNVNDLERVTLNYQPKELVFDFTGRNIDKAETLYTANFVETLKKDIANTVQTQDGSVLKEQIDKLIVEKNVSKDVSAIIYGLLSQALAD